MDYKKHNLARFVSYFDSCSKEMKLVGLKIEHFVVRAHTWEPLTYLGGIKQLLEKLVPACGKPIYSGENLIGIKRDGVHLNLEAGGQLKVILGPSSGVMDLKQLYDDFLGKINPILEDMGCKLLTFGYRPVGYADDFPLVPSKRYEILMEYFKQSGLMGKQALKGAAATHVSIEYRDESDFKKKFRVASILAPLFALICDNSKFFEGEPFKGRMLRAQIWSNVCPFRSNLVLGCLDKDFGFLDYASYIYEMPAIMVLRGGELEPVVNSSFSQIYAGTQLEEADIQLAVSMAYPDVCLKGHIEIRVADSLPIHMAIAYVALVKGLMYDEFNLDNLYDMTLGVRSYDVLHAKQELIGRGIDGVIYSRTVRDWLKRIFYMSQAGLGSDELPYFLPLEAFIT